MRLVITREAKKLSLVFGNERICPFGNTMVEGSREMVASMTHTGKNWQPWDYGQHIRMQILWAERKPLMLFKNRLLTPKGSIKNIHVGGRIGMAFCYKGRVGINGGYCP